MRIGYELRVEDRSTLHVCCVCGAVRIERAQRDEDADDEQPSAVDVLVIVTDERAQP